MTNLKALMQSGAYTLSAQTIMPSTTLPAHASMVVGTCPAKHIVRWNEYVPENGYALGTDIFDIAKAAGYRTVIVAGKEKLHHLTASTDFFGFIDTTDRFKDITTLENMAIEQLRLDFGLMLMHFPDGDLAGHEFGWMSDQQLRAYKRDDGNLGLFIDVMKSREIFDDTLFIITSDHGGHDSTHGTELPEDMTIPWIISGPRVVPGVLQTPVYIMDTAPTIALALGLPFQADWDGVPVYEAFGIPYDGPPKTGCPGLTP
jgi:predicted AlkP superfamily pyrophosphatase or phosphodiesterase